MRNRNKSLYLTIGVICLCLLVTIGVLQKNMNKVIVDNKLTDTDPVLNAPPIVAITCIAFGSFRGLLADILWLRSIALQDQGQYFEMVQLASWIVKLQPRFTGAIAHLAWNMAYNISVTCSSYEDRWRWVQQGIELIRDEALNYNPSDPLLYKELGWIYQHKLGNIMDDANIYYKNKMALEFTKVFGGPEPNWKKLENAPKTASDLENNLNNDNNAWKTIEKEGYSLSSLTTEFRGAGKLPEKISKVISPLAKSILDSYLRARWIEQVYKLRPSVIITLNKKYGKLDWRLPESQAIYWAYLGIQHSPEKKDINCERMITQSLAVIFKAGRLLMVDKEGFQSVMTIPNLKVVDAVRNEFLKAYDIHKQSSFKSALENFMKDAIVTLYTYGSYKKAKEYLEELRKEFPGNKNYKVNVDLFVLKEWAEDVRDASMKQAMGLVSGLLYRRCNFLTFGDYDAAQAHLKLAKFVYNRYQQSIKDSEGRVGLPPLGDIQKKVVAGCMKSFPPPLAKSLEFALEQLKVEANEASKEETKTPKK